MTRDEFIAGLRAAAAFVERHPELPCPELPLTVNVWVYSKTDLAQLAKLGPWNKRGDPNYFWLQRNITPSLSYEININREQVCRRIVKGTRTVPAQEAHDVEVVEWICDEPLLAMTEQAVTS